MSALWNYLNSPQLVYEFQKACGIERRSDGKKEEEKYRIKNKFLYYLFIIGTELGDELFYGIFIPFCFFNLDGYIGRRFVFNWFINMYVGQALKEFFLEERPKFPAIQMQKKWSNEYSLPSTHAMSSPSIAVTIVYFALDRYEINFTIAAVIWISVVSWSRVYLGMHSVLDLLMGFFLSAILLAIGLPFTEAIELFLAKHLFAPPLLLTIVIILMIYFPIPSTRIWTPTKGDTLSIAAVFVGIELGTWFNYQCGYLNEVNLSYPLSFELGNYTSLVLRTVVGLAFAGATEFVGKSLTYSVLCTILNEDKKQLKNMPDSVDNKQKNFIELTTKFVTYSALGFNVLFTVPIIFQYLNIQRDSFYTEI